MLKGMLTDKQRTFLMNLPEDRLLTSNERHYVSKIRRKAKKALKDLDLIFEKLPQSYLIFPEQDIPSLKNPIEEVTKILYFQNYRNEFLKRRKQRSKRKINKEAISRKTRKQINDIINSVLNQLQTKP